MLLLANWSCAKVSLPQPTAEVTFTSGSQPAIVQTQEPAFQELSVKEERPVSHSTYGSLPKPEESDPVLGKENLPKATYEEQVEAQSSSKTVGKLSGRRICLDPGHDSLHVPGAAARDAGGRVVFNEHELTRLVASRLKGLLEAEDAQVCVTRNEAGFLQISPYDFNGNGTTGLPGDTVERTQPRIDFMNHFGAEFVLSIHFNGYHIPAISGTEAYYTDAGPYQQENRRFAERVLHGLAEKMEESGYSPVVRGIHSDRYKTEYLDYTGMYGFDRGCSECTRLITLGNNPMSKNKGTWKVSALVEVLFLTNPQDVRFLQRPDALDIITDGLAQGIIAYFTEIP